MNEIQRNGVSIDICPKCKGVWLDGKEMEKLLSQVRQYEQEYETRLESYRKQYGSLPTHQRNPYDTDGDGTTSGTARRKAGWPGSSTSSTELPDTLAGAAGL